MLPAFTAQYRRAAVATITALAIALPTAPAFAFNQREQDVLKGVFGTLIIGGLINEAQKSAKKRAAPRYDAPYQPPRHAPQPVAANIYATPAATAFNTYPLSQRRMIQRRLSLMGYYRGGIDGSFGPGTYSAVAAYARDQGQTRDLASTRTSFAIYDGLAY